MLRKLPLLLYESDWFLLDNPAFETEWKYQNIQNKMVLFRINTKVAAYNHQHPGMATCFGLF